MKHKEDAADPCLPLMIWLAYEPRLTRQRNAALEWLRDNAAGNALVTDAIVPRTLHRLVAAGRPDNLAACVAFLGAVKDSAVRRRAWRVSPGACRIGSSTPRPDGKPSSPPCCAIGTARCSAWPGGWRLTSATARQCSASLAIVRDATRSTAERRDAVRNLGLARPAQAQRPLLDIVLHDKDTELRCEACRALAGYESVEVAKAVLGGWKSYSPPLRVEAVNLLAGRKDWAIALLMAVGQKKVPRTDLSDNTILRIRAFRDRRLNKQIEDVWGRVRDTPAELNALINKMRGELSAGPASLRGRKVFDNQCVNVTNSTAAATRSGRHWTGRHATSSICW